MISYAVFYNIYEDQAYNKCEGNPTYAPWEPTNKYFKSFNKTYMLSESGWCGAHFLGVF